MVRVKNTGGGKVRHRGIGITVNPGDTADVPEDTADILVDRHNFERVDPSETEANDEESTDSEENTTDTDSDAGEWMVALEDVGPAKADKLEDAGIASVEDVQEATVEDLAAVDGISEATAESIKDQLSSESEE